MSFGIGFGMHVFGIGSLSADTKIANLLVTTEILVSVIQ